jgi:hypothetical protein
MTFDETPRFPRGFRCASRNCGIKPSGRDLSLFVSDVDAAAAAVFTRNRFPGAPIVLGRETIRGGVLRAIVVNSKVSNVATGAEGLENARRMAAAAAAEVGTTPDRVLVSSTGVIGVPLPIEKIEAGLRGMAGGAAGRPAGRRRGHHDDGHAPEGALRAPSATRRSPRRQGLGHDRAEHGDDARLHLHRRRVDAADARPHAARRRGRLLQHAVGGHRHEHVRHLRHPRQRPAGAVDAARSRTRSGRRASA